MLTLRSIVNDGVYRVSAVTTSPFSFLSSLGKNTKNLVFVFKENKILKKELEQLKLKKFNAEYLFNINKDLRKTLDSADKVVGKKILSKVILDKNSPYLKSIVINHGSKHGILKGMPALDGNYLIGRVVETNYLSSRILLLNDLNSRIPVVLADEIAAQSIISGSGDLMPELKYLPESYIPRNGLNIFTSGKDGIFTPGIPIGVTKIDNNNAKVKLFSDPNQLSYISIHLLDVGINKF